MHASGDPAGVRGKPGSGFGYGAGIRVDSPLGPLRLEYAFNDSRTRRFHFGIGYRNWWLHTPEGRFVTQISIFLGIWRFSWNKVICPSFLGILSTCEAVYLLIYSMLDTLNPVSSPVMTCHTQPCDINFFMLRNTQCLHVYTYTPYFNYIFFAERIITYKRISQLSNMKALK